MLEMNRMDRSSPDPLDLSELVSLSKELLALAVEISGAIDPKNVVVGQDETGAVRAVVDCTGGVRQIQLEEGWHEKIRPSEFGRAVISANQDGQAKRIEAWAQIGADRAGVAIQLPRPTGNASFAAENHDVDPAAVWRRVSEAFATEIEGHAPSHAVRVRAIGPNVTRVLADERWLLRTHHEDVAEQVTAAFHDLYGRLPDEVVDALAIDAVSSEINDVSRRLAQLERDIHRPSL